MFARVCCGCGEAAFRSGLCRGCAGRLERAGLADRVVEPVGIDRVVALHAYDPTVRALVLAAKNRGQRRLLDRWGRELAARLGDPAPGDAPGSREGPVDVVTWVPASRHRVRSRGFDQGRLLAGALAAAAGVPARRLLVRRPGSAQTGADRTARLVGPDLRAPLVTPSRVLLVDDVLTTGASLSAGAQALRRAGATAVIGAVVAVVGKPVGAGIH